MIAVDSFFLFSWASESWWLGIWTSLNTIALIVTLIFVRKYTKSTKELATATRSMAAAHREEVGLRERPVVSFGCADEKQFIFLTTARNFSMVHAKARVKATVIVNRHLLSLTPEHHYAGERVWHLQAGGSGGPTFRGHLDFPTLFEYNNVPQPDPNSAEAQVTIESWVINWAENDSELFNDQNKNPTLQWYWKPRFRQWVPEVSPRSDYETVTLDSRH